MKIKEVIIKKGEWLLDALKRYIQNVILLLLSQMFP